MSNDEQVCPRCRLVMRATIQSMFNEDMICMDCKEIECKHPRYQEAVEADIAAVNSGNYNFPGIGLPPDLAKQGN